MEWSAQVASFVPQEMSLFQQVDMAILLVVSNALIALSFMGIALASLRFIQSREDLPPVHRRMALLFTTLMVLCGLTHVASIFAVWFPVFAVEATVETARAVIAMFTAVWLSALVPMIRKLPSMRAMRREIAAHAETMAALDAARAELAAKVDQTEGELRIAEQHRHLSTALLGTVIENVPGPIYAKDRDGRLLLVNTAGLNLLGRQWSDIEGKRDNEFMRDVRRAELIMADDRQVIESGMIGESELIFNHPDRGPRAYLSNKVPLRYADGEIGGLVGISIDITERKRLARELLHVSRRTAMGEMAAALAHELHQPLAAIGLYLDGSAAVLKADGYEGPLVRSLKLAKDQ